jgi:hypothetical protein
VVEEVRYFTWVNGVTTQVENEPSSDEWEQCDFIEEDYPILRALYKRIGSDRNGCL